jgi:hypothetical protein
VSDPATYCFSTPRIQPLAVARWHAHLHGLATPTREICGFARSYSYQKCPMLSSRRKDGAFASRQRTAGSRQREGLWIANLEIPD